MFQILNEGTTHFQILKNGISNLWSYLGRFVTVSHSQRQQVSTTLFVHSPFVFGHVEERYYQ